MFVGRDLLQCSETAVAQSQPPFTIRTMLEKLIVSWGELFAADPRLALVAQQIFESHPHHVIATLKPDGSPRVGGTNVFFTKEEMWIGSMRSALRNGDLRRSPQCAIHSAPLDENLQEGDVRLDAIAQELRDDEASALLRSRDQEGDGVVFTLKVARISLVRVEGNDLVIEAWDQVAGCTTHHLR